MPFGLEAITQQFEETNPELDQVKKSVLGELDELKKSDDLNELEVNMFSSAKTGFEADLRELGVSDKDREKYLAEFQTKWRELIGPAEMEAILKSPEKTALDNFIASVASIQGLKEIIKTAEPQMKIVNWLEDKLSVIPDSIKKWFGGVEGIKNEILLVVAGILPGKMGEALKASIKTKQEMVQAAEAAQQSEGASAETPAESAAQTEREKEKAEKERELPPEHLAAIKPLEDIGITINRNTVAEDMRFFQQRDIDAAELAQKASKGNLKDIYIKAKTALGEDISQLQFELKDAYAFDEESSTSNPERVRAIKEIISSKQRTPAQIRDMLNDARRATFATADLAKKYSPQESSETASG